MRNLINLDLKNRSISFLNKNKSTFLYCEFNLAKELVSFWPSTARSTGKVSLGTGPEKREQIPENWKFFFNDYTRTHTAPPPPSEPDSNQIINHLRLVSRPQEPESTTALCLCMSVSVCVCMLVSVYVCHRRFISSSGHCRSLYVIFCLWMLAIKGKA